MCDCINERVREYSLVTGPVVCVTVLMSENSLVTGPVV